MNAQNNKLRGNRPVKHFAAVLALVGLTAGASMASAQITQINTPPAQTSGGTVYSISASTPAGTLLEGGTPSLVGGEFSELVYLDATGYVFLFQVTPMLTDGDAVVNVTVGSAGGGFKTFSPTESFYTGPLTLASTTYGTATNGEDLTQPGDVTSINVNGVVDFNVGNLAQGGIPNNANSDWLVIQTNAKSIGLGNISIQDDIAANGTAFVPFTGVNPTPEASTVLFGLAISCVIGFGAVRKFSKAVSPSIGNGFAV